MGGYLNKEDRDMITNSLLKHRPKVKKVYDSVSTIIFNFILFVIIVPSHFFTC